MITGTDKVIFEPLAQLVERNPSKFDVVSLNLTRLSKKEPVTK